jgi:hypothetical protein
MSKGFRENQTWYDLMQVCENGHLITRYGRSQPENLVDRCTKCGERTLTACPNCNAEILGHKHIPGVFVGENSPPPDFCRQCGTKYPWAGKTGGGSAALPPPHRAERILDRFHAVARQLRSRHANRPTLEIEDEYDVQDLLHALLKLGFDDIRPEEWTPSYAGSCSRMDFLLKPERLVVEVKKTSKSVGAKEVGDQLLVDIARYKMHPDCKMLVCFVYDPEGRIGNAKGLARDLEASSTDTLKVVVVIRP